MTAPTTTGNGWRTDVAEHMCGGGNVAAGAGNSGVSGKLNGPRLDEGAGRMLVAPARPTPCQPSSQNKEQ